MIKALIDNRAGIVEIGQVAVGTNFNFELFESTFLHDSNIIYGQLGDAKYCMKESVELFDNSFMACLIFNENSLRQLEFVRSDLLVPESDDPAEVDKRVRGEFEYLDALLRGKFGHKVHSIRPYFNRWDFFWGRIELVYQIQDSTVYVGVSWNKC
ncbi:MAG: hypothetical protein V4857_05330 [Pseudomonadota bacterium]